VFLALLLAAVTALPSDGLPIKAPVDVGMSAERLETIDRVVQRGLDAGGYPGAAVVVGRKGAAVWEKGFGHLGWTADSPAVLPDRTIYDLASLTKVIGTTTAAMILYDEGKLDLDERVTHYLPAFSGGNKDLVTVRELLEHRSGLPAGRDLWRHAHTPEEAKQLVLETPLEYRPDHGQIYSDLGADVLGWVIEAISGVPLDRFLTDRVFQPLGMNDTEFRPADSLVYRIAPTEVSPPRGYPLQGEVHDENAYALGGVAGHAGLFGTASDLAVFAQMMLDGGTYNGARIVADSTVRLFTTRASGDRALGWEVADGTHGAGNYLSSDAYGHTGFTGTSIWIDPDREMFVILLTNRVHAPRAKRPAKVIADVRADLADAAALAVTDANLAVAEMPVSFRADRAVGWNRPVRVARSRRRRVARTSAAAQNVPAPKAKRVTHGRTTAGKHVVARKKANTSAPAKRAATKSTSTKQAAIKSPATKHAAIRKAATTRKHVTKPATAPKAGEPGTNRQ
jgi:CubicO group peptidase (beta-lactamase class C family)